MSYPMKQPQELSRKFKSTFGMNLFDYWSVLHGFDIVQFDEFIGTPKGVSCREQVAKKWGDEAVKIIEALIDYPTRTLGKKGVIAS